MSRLTNIFLLAYLYWVAFEWILVSPLGSYALIQAIRNTMDVLPLVLLMGAIVVLNVPFRRVDLKVFGAFLGIALISALSLFLEIGNPAPVTGWVGVTFRFVPLLILVRFTDETVPRLLFTNLRIIYWIEAGLAVLNLISKQWFVGTFMPSPDLFGEVLPTSYTDAGISASFINTVEFSFFMVAATLLYLHFSQNRKERTAVIIVSSVLIILSFSIASILSLLLIFFILTKRKKIFILISSIFLILLLVSGRGLVELFLGMDIAYWVQISSDFNRLGYFTKVLPEFLGGNLKDILLGMGYDSGIVDNTLANYRNAPWVMIVNENNLKYLKDVYWLSILLVQGVLSLGLMGYTLGSLYKEAKGTLRSKDFKLVRNLLIITIFLGFFNQILDIKSFTWIFWLSVSMAFYQPLVQESKNEAVAGLDIGA